MEEVAMDSLVWLGILILFFAVPVTAETVFSLVFSPDARCGGRAVRVAAPSQEPDLRGPDIQDPDARAIPRERK